VAGAHVGIEPLDVPNRVGIPLWFLISQSFLLKRTLVSTGWLACVCGKVWTDVHDVRSARSRVTRMKVGLSNVRSGNVDLMTVSLDTYGGGDASSVLDPLGRSPLLAAENRQINSQASQSHPGGKLILTSGFQSHRNTAVLCK
jgi:hypothetical protein